MKSLKLCIEFFLGFHVFLDSNVKLNVKDKLDDRNFTSLIHCDCHVKCHSCLEEKQAPSK